MSICFLGQPQPGSDKKYQHVKPNNCPILRTSQYLLNQILSNSFPILSPIPIHRELLAESVGTGFVHIDVLGIVKVYFSSKKWLFSKILYI